MLNYGRILPKPHFRAINPFAHGVGLRRALSFYFVGRIGVFHAVKLAG